MKKFVIKISLAFVILAALILILLVLLSHDEDIPSYRFLGGLNPAAYKEFNDKSHAEDRLYIYSFEGDFNDVCTKARAELISAGFVDRTLPTEKSRMHTFWLKEFFHRNPVNIRIYNNHMYIEKDDAIGPKDGWIVVEVGYWPGQWRLF